MDKKTFIISSIIIVIIVSIITSLIAISYLSSPLLAPGQEGTVGVTGGLDTAIVDVIIIDSTVESTLTDTIIFNNVERGQTYTTTTADSYPKEIRPFVIRNMGNTPANVAIYQSYTGDGLFLSSNSKLQFWVENPVGGWINIPPPVAVVDNCNTNGKDLGGVIRCFIPGSCNTISNACNVPVGAGNEVGMLTNLLSQDDQDEALLGIKIIVAADEPATTSQRVTTITIIGSATPNPIV